MPDVAPSNENRNEDRPFSISVPRTVSKNKELKMKITRLNLAVAPGFSVVRTR
jgi:hypothetical protein